MRKVWFAIARHLRLSDIKQMKTKDGARAAVARAMRHIQHVFRFPDSLERGILLEGMSARGIAMINKKIAFGIAVAATTTVVLGIMLLFGSERHFASVDQAGVNRPIGTT